MSYNLTPEQLRSFQNELHHSKSAATFLEPYANRSETRSGYPYGLYDPRYAGPTGGNIAARRSRRVKSKSKTKSKSRRTFRGSRRR